MSISQEDLSKFSIITHLLLLASSHCIIFCYENMFSLHQSESFFFLSAACIVSFF